MTRWTPDQINAAFDRAHAAANAQGMWAGQQAQHLIYSPGQLINSLVPNRIAELERELKDRCEQIHLLDAMFEAVEAQRDHAGQRNAFLADQNAKLFREVQALRGRLTAFVDPDHQPHSMPANALRRPRKVGWEAMR
jgi:hypothetical protein